MAKRRSQGLGIWRCSQEGTVKAEGDEQEVEGHTLLEAWGQ